MRSIKHKHIDNGGYVYGGVGALDTYKRMVNIVYVGTVAPPG